jgi:hypothetical protein
MFFYIPNQNVLETKDIYDMYCELPDAHLAVERGLLPSTTTASTVVDLRPYCFGLT